MGQKVSPTGFRLGITEEWRSRWYADKDYAKNLANDLAIRKFLDKQLARAAVSKIEIERAGDKIKIIVTLSLIHICVVRLGAFEWLGQLRHHDGRCSADRSGAGALCGNGIPVLALRLHVG